MKTLITLLRAADPSRWKPALGLGFAALVAVYSLNLSFQDGACPRDVSLPTLGWPSKAPVWSHETRRTDALHVTVTGYSSTGDQTDSTPFVTASNTRVRSGVIALSRDLLATFTPGAPFDFGDEVELEGLGRFIVEDTMAARYTKRADIWFPSRAVAIRWGKKRMKLHGLSPESGPDLPAARLFESAYSD